MQDSGTNNTMTGTQDAVFAIFNAEHSSGQTVFNGVSFTNNTATIDPITADDGGAVYAGAHSSAAGSGGLGWDTVNINCNTFLNAKTDVGVRFFNPTGVDDQALGGASIDVTNNWWGSSDALVVAYLMQIPSITDFTPFLSSAPGDNCPSVEVALDIKPQSCPNPLNVKSKGLLSVAILGTDDFDVSSINIATLTLEGISPVKNSIEDVAGLSISSEPCGCEGVGPDTNQDLTLKFDRKAIIDKIIATYGPVENGDEILLTLTGELTDGTPGTPIEGSDCVVIKGVK